MGNIANFVVLDAKELNFIRLFYRNYKTLAV